MYDRPYFYLTFGGSLFPLASGHEQWQTGLKFAPDTGTDPATMQSRLLDIDLDEILANCSTLIAGGYGSGVGWSNCVSIDWAKLAVIKTDGEYQGAAQVREQTGHTGGSGSFAVAPQLACVVSFWSGDTFGQANRGRSYLPVPYTFLGSLTVLEPRATVVQAAALRDAFSEFLGHVAGEVDGVTLSTVPAIMSSLGTGTTKPIAQISVGRVVDTMRSRRTSLVEDPDWQTYP